MPAFADETPLAENQFLDRSKIPRLSPRIAPAEAQAMMIQMFSAWVLPILRVVGSNPARRANKNSDLDLGAKLGKQEEVNLRVNSR
jgi:hypothetical protein